MSISDVDKFKHYISSILTSSTSSLPLCNYYTEQEFKTSYQSLGTHDLSIFHLNIRSLNANHNKLVQTMITLCCSFDVILLTEVWTYNIAMYKNLFPDYNFYYALPFNSNIGGVGVYINKSFTVTERTDLKLNCSTQDNMAESIFVEACRDGRHYLIGTIYRHPNCSIPKFSLSLETLLFSSIFPLKTDCFLIGDLNFDLLKYDTQADIARLIDILINYSFIPCSTLPTRITDTSATLIDHIYYRPGSNIKNISLEKIFTGNLTIDISDHLANFIILPTSSNKSLATLRPFIRLFSDVNKNSFQDELSNCDWNGCVLNINDVDASISGFMSCLSQAFHKCFPLVRLSRKKYKEKKWVTLEVKKSSNIKSKLYKKWLITRTPVDRDSYKSHLKIHNKIVKTAESNYYSRTFDSSIHSTKALWKEINKLCCFGSNRSTEKPEIAKLNLNGSVVTDPLSMASALNNYFCEVGSDLVSKLPVSNCTLNFRSFLPPSILNSFVCDTISLFDIHEIINKLKRKNKSGPDEFNVKLIDEFEFFISAPLCHIYNLSLTSGIFPSVFKLAKVVSIYKKGDHSSLSNYRPISLLSTFSKMFESIIDKRLRSFLTKNNILYNYQFGFRPHYSTKLALIDSIDEIYKLLDNRFYVAAIFLDLAKAFDTIDHAILLEKLDNYGFRGQMFQWFQKLPIRSYPIHGCKLCKFIPKFD